MVTRQSHKEARNAIEQTNDTASQGVVLLATKLSHPRLPSGLVVRERLLKELDAAVERRLTLLSASAGWGKTTLLGEWSSRHAHPVAWVSLDALDNDPTRFWVAVISALRTCVPAVGAPALAMLNSPKPPPFTAILTVLLNELAESSQPSPVVLVLDDYHVISNPDIHEAITFLIEHLPPQLHVVLTTRIDPELPLARWRVRGGLAEIRAADLRFTQTEAAAFLARAVGDTVGEEIVRQLDSRTEGWIAGLQLAAIAMRQHENRSAFVQAFTGSHRYLMDYVQEEILQRQPLPVRRFLIQIAVLRRMNAEVCSELIEETTSQAAQEMLERLERNNLFLVPLDDQRQWYRMHDLFREVLLARLRATWPEMVPVLHRRAARWYDAEGELQEAIDHALAGADFSYAALMIEREAPRLWLSGKAQRVHGWVQALPDIVLQEHLRLALDSALRLLESLNATVKEAYTRGQAQAEEIMARLEAVLQSHKIPDTEVALIRGRIRLLRALTESRTLLLRGDIEHMRLLAQETAQLAKKEEISWKMIAISITCWLTESLQREGALLIPMLLAAKQQAIAEEDHLAAVRVMRWLAFAYGSAGRLRLVRQECLDSLALVEQTGEYSSTTGYLYYFQASAYWGWNRLEEARALLQKAVRIGRAWQQADLLISGNASLAALLLSLGDTAAAYQALNEAEEVARREEFALHTEILNAMRAEYWLATGNLEAASKWAEQFVFSQETWYPNRKWGAVTLVRVYLAQQRYPQALDAIERYSPYIDRPGDVRTTISLLAMQVTALHQVGKPEQAKPVLARLLSLTEPEDNIRVFLDCGEPMKQALRSVIGGDLSPNHDNSIPGVSLTFISKLLAAFDQEAQRLNGLRIDDAVGSLHSAHRPAAAIPNNSAIDIPHSAFRIPHSVEPLTRREHDVLQLLVAGASNQEIATELVISMATVKKHVSNLFGKLGVTSRAQAIARARDWSYLA